MGKIAIIKDDYDLLRIVPFNKSEDKYDFKISMLKNRYALRIYQTGKPGFLYSTEDITDWEFSYHGQLDDKPAKIHAKHMSEPKLYKDFPLANLIDMKINSEFPLPLMKMGVCTDESFKRFKKKDKYSMLDMKEGNVAEFYLLNNNFDMDNFMIKWDIFHFLFLVLPMEYYSNGKMDLNIYKMNFFADSKKDTYFTQGQFKVSDEISVMINSYYDPHVDSKKQQSYLSFFENGSYLKYLSNVPVVYEFPNGKKTVVKPAYKVQLERNRQMLSDEEFDYWRAIFEKWELELKREGVRLQGVILEAHTE